MTATTSPRLGRLPATALPVTRWAAASRAEMAILIAYFVLVLAVTDIINVRLGVELMTLVVLLAATLITRRPLQFLRDWWFMLVGLILWNLSGPVAALSPFHTHLDFMLNVDKVIGLGHQPVVEVQSHLSSGPQVNALDWITAIGYNLHVPEPYIAGYLLWRINRSVYFVFAMSALALLSIGLITFILFPAVPPWMASQWFHRIPGVTNRFGPVLQAHPLPFHGTPIFYIFQFRGDAVAAFPSEHAAFPLLEMLAFGLALGRRAYVGFGIWVLWVLFTILYLGEHWVTDALAGYVYAAVIFFAVLWSLRALGFPDLGLGSRATLAADR